MDQGKYSTEKRIGKHLCLWERQEIENALRRGASIRSIAKNLGRNPSTISREVGRGSVMQRRMKEYISSRADDPGYTEQRRYFADTGQRKTKANIGNRGGKYKLFEDMKLVRYIEDCILGNKWAPASILGGLNKQGHSFKIMVCFKTVYNYIDRGQLSVKNIDLLLKPRLRAKKRRIMQHRRILGKSIELRPASVNDRQEFGHWEADSVVGKEGKSAIMTLVERKTNKGFILALKDKSSGAVMTAFNRLRKSCPKGLFKSVTFDNGSEFAKCHRLEKQGLQIYFAHPYSAFERGCNENYNGIIRRYIPKGKDMTCFKQADLNRINNLIDSLPRKRLKYKTAEMMFNLELEKISLTPWGKRERE